MEGAGQPVTVCGGEEEEEWGRRESKYEAFLRPYARPAAGVGGRLRTAFAHTGHDQTLDTFSFSW